MKSPTNSECEAWLNGEWAIISVATALTYKDQIVRRCAECKGAIRLHRAGAGNKPRAHAEHMDRFPGCSLGDCFDGKPRSNPSQVQASGSPAEPIAFATEEVLGPETFSEGATELISVNRYERDPDARKSCLRHYGYVCAVCDKSMEQEYGKLARKVIHVHHLKPLGEIGEAYIIDAIADLRPVCPNCHAVIHSKPGRPFTIEEVRDMRRAAAV